METNEKNRAYKMLNNGIGTCIFIHIITFASLPTEPPRLYMSWSLFVAKSVQSFYLQCYYFSLNELE